MRHDFAWAKLDSCSGNKAAILVLPRRHSKYQGVDAGAVGDVGKSVAVGVSVGGGGIMGGGVTV